MLEAALTETLAKLVVELVELEVVTKKGGDVDSVEGDVKVEVGVGKVGFRKGWRSSAVRVEAKF